MISFDSLTCKLGNPAMALLGAAALSISISATAEAAILFQNPFAGQQIGYTSSSGFRVYDSFTLSSNSTLTGFQFSTWSTAQVPTTFDVTIYTDNTFTTTLFNQSYNIASATVTTDPVGGVAQLIAVSLPSLSLAAGTYWISPFRTSGNPLTLNASNPILDGSAIRKAITLGTITNLGQDLAMVITGTTATVPAPGSLTLLGVGLLGLVNMRRKFGY